LEQFGSIYERFGAFGIILEHIRGFWNIFGDLGLFSLDFGPFQVRSGQFRSGQVRSGQVRSGQVRSGQAGQGDLENLCVQTNDDDEQPGRYRAYPDFLLDW
jgi:hypothetical protein